MRVSALALLPCLAIAAACSGGSGDPPGAAGQSPAVNGQTTNLPDDDSILARLYDPDYTAPEGFFVDERTGTAQSYTVHHVLDETGAFELCTDDFATAQAWESADNLARSVNGYYVGAYENDRYFEFIRELSYDDDVGNIVDLTSPGFARVFKCSALSRDGVDRSALSGFAGRINSRPLDAAAMRDFAEYFWQFTFFPARQRKVLDSINVAGGAPARTLLLAFASSAGDAECDRVEVVEWRFSADPDSGAVYSEFVTIRTLAAMLVAGSPMRCG